VLCLFFVLFLYLCRVRHAAYIKVSAKRTHEIATINLVIAGRSRRCIT